MIVMYTNSVVAIPSSVEDKSEAQEKGGKKSRKTK